jgi:hypothetical protein
MADHIFGNPFSRRLSSTTIRNLLRIAECHDISLDELVAGKAASVKTEDFWPFSVNRKTFFQLPRRRKKAIDDYIRILNVFPLARHGKKN